MMDSEEALQAMCKSGGDKEFYSALPFRKLSNCYEFPRNGDLVKGVLLDLRDAPDVDPAELQITLRISGRPFAVLTEHTINASGYVVFEIPGEPFPLVGLRFTFLECKPSKELPIPVKVYGWLQYIADFEKRRELARHDPVRTVQFLK
jgi:hypothetical protein